MQEADEGDGYSDDDLDALPADAFQELQQNAIRSTQQLEHNEQLVLPSRSFQGLSGPESLRKGFGNLILSGNASYKAPAQIHPQQASSDYGDFDDEMLDGEIFDAAEEPIILKERGGGFTARPLRENTQREQWRQQRFGAPPRPHYELGVDSLHARPLPTPQVRQGAKGKDQYDAGDKAKVTYEGSQKPREPPSEGSGNVKFLESQVEKVLSSGYRHTTTAYNQA
jgi:hypothetical protein